MYKKEPNIVTAIFYNLLDQISLYVAAGVLTLADWLGFFN